MLLGTLRTSLLGNLLTGRGAMATSQGRVNRAGKGCGINRADKGVLRAGYGRPSSSASHNNKIDFQFCLIP